MRNFLWRVFRGFLVWNTCIEAYERVEEEEPRWWSRKSLDSPPLTSTPKSQLTAERPWMKKTEIHQKRSSTARDIKKESQWDGQEVWTHDTTKFHTPQWATHKLENNYITDILPQEWKFWAPHQATPPDWHPAPRRGTPRAFGFEGQQGSISGTPQDWRK